MIDILINGVSMGYYNHGDRFDDPKSGRFINQDPAGEGSNLYAYVGNDPVTMSDPTGLSEFNPGGSFAGLGGSGLTLQQNYSWSKTPNTVPISMANFGIAGHRGSSLSDLAPRPSGVTYAESWKQEGGILPDLTGISLPVNPGPSAQAFASALAYDIFDFGINAGVGWFQGNGMATNITPSRTLPGSIGRVTGYVGAMAQGVGEMIGGGGMEAGGIIGAPETLGLSLIATYGGTIVTAHGAAVAGNSIRLLVGTSIGQGSQLGNLQTGELYQTGRPNNVSQSNPYLKGHTPQPGTRRTGVERAKRLEVELVQKTGKGTANWTSREIEYIKQTGQLPKDAVGHHINSVSPYDDWAGDPRNIKFVRGQEANLTEHGGNFQSSTTGPLIDRQSLINAAKGVGE